MPPEPSLSPPPKESTPAWRALRALDFDWTVHLRSVWRDISFDAPGIHKSLRDEFASRLDELKSRESTDSPLGWIILGQPGSGKTHWLSQARRQARDQGFWFVLVDMTDVRDFWSTVLQGYLESLHRDWSEGRTQLSLVLEAFLNRFRLNVPVADALRYLASYGGEKLGEALGRLIPLARRLFPAEAARHQDVLRALFAHSSYQSDIHAAGLNWLQGNPVDGETRSLLGFVRNPEEPHRIVEALSWIMSLAGPTVLALDQLDPIVSQLDPSARSQGMEASPEGLRALAIIHEIAHGLGALRDTTCRTLTIVTCIDATLTALKRHSVSSWLDRFETPRPLASQIDGFDAQAMIEPRVAQACQGTDWTPPFPSWPIRPEAFAIAQGLSPRDLLKACDAHRRQCLNQGAITLLDRFGDSAPVAVEPLASGNDAVEALFQKSCAEIPIGPTRGEEADEDHLGQLLLGACQCLLLERELPEGFHASLDDFRGAKTAPALHARIRLIHHAQGDREEHFSFRFLEKTHASAFQARLRAASSGSGIDKKLSFRHCLILRSSDFPKGNASQKLLETYKEQGGDWYRIDPDTLAVMFGIERILRDQPPGWETWLKQRRPASGLGCFSRWVQRLDALIAATPAKPTSSREPSPGPTSIEPVRSDGVNPVMVPAPGAPAGPEATGPSGEPVPLPQATDWVDLPLGVRKIGSRTETVTLPLRLLEKHSMVLAGAGSGKTVLLKRLVEEAALAGIPSIVIDGAGDLAAFSEAWPQPPEHWTETDQEKSQAFRERIEVVTWTPGRESGNNLIFEPLPNLAEAASDPEELTMAIDAAVDALASLALSGKGPQVEKKKGILAKALRHFATSGGGTLEDFLAVLDPLPAEAGLGISREERMAKEMADTLKAKRETSPMLRGSGTGLDPAALFGDAPHNQGRVRISVISLIGLATQELRQQFVYQLGMTLFGWIKRHPHPPGRSLRGLLVVDEARDFLPSGKTVPSKASLQLLASQARKYHLGLLLATQMPKEVENRVIGNCATHFYGRASSPAAIQAIQELLQARGGHADDIAALKAGQFYAYNSEAGMKQPVKIQVPMCLTCHRVMEEGEILVRAASDRVRLFGD